MDIEEALQSITTSMDENACGSNVENQCITMEETVEESNQELQIAEQFVTEYVSPDVPQSELEDQGNLKMNPEQHSISNSVTSVENEVAVEHNSIVRDEELIYISRETSIATEVEANIPENNDNSCREKSLPVISELEGHENSTSADDKFHQSNVDSITIVDSSCANKDGEIGSDKGHVLELKGDGDAEVANRENLLEEVDAVQDNSTLNNHVEHLDIQHSEGDQLSVLDKVQEEMIELADITSPIESHSEEKHAGISEGQSNSNLDVVDVIKEKVGMSQSTSENDIEKQISNIVETGESKEGDVEQISIAEAISRDFDEPETDDADIKQGSSEGLETLTVVSDSNVVVDNINVQQDSVPVTVTDNTGQVYYVQSVEDLIVVENDALDQSDTIEVTVLCDSDENSQEVQKTGKPKEKSQIPSHILGRNIDNPVIDTFRNGKVPPKPRLGVKIPYKNLTSQIVSKDEIAREILKRQKQKYKQPGQTTKEVLFAQKLTQRLAKKINPSQTEKFKEEVAINDSELLAILEGDDDEDKVASTSNDNPFGQVPESGSKTLLTAKTDSGKLNMSKLTEREIALKQLMELPAAPRRRKHLSSIYSTIQVNDSTSTNELVQNDVVLEVPENKNKTSIPLKTESGKSMSKATEKEIALKQLTEVTASKHRKNIDKTSLVYSKTPVGDLTSSQIKDNEPLESLASKGVTKVGRSDIGNKVTTGDIETTDSVVKDKVTSAKEKDRLLTSSEASSEVIVPTTSPIFTPHSSTVVDSETEISKIQGAVAKDLIKESKEIRIEIVEPAKVDVKESPPIASSIENKTKISAGEAKQIANTKANETLAKSAECIKSTSGTSEQKQEFIEYKPMGTPPIKTYARKRKSTDEIVPNVPEKKLVAVNKDVNIPPNMYVTKSSRIIKKKVIWDPDEPSPTRTLIPKPSKTEATKLERSHKPEANLSKLEKKQSPRLTAKIIDTKSPTKSPDINKGKKRLTEVDKLLMDEGAIKMLYAFKKVDESAKKKKSAVISLDKVQRELINKTNEIKRDLKTNSDKVSPKSLRRKDSPVPASSKKVIPASISRQKSKDSNRSSLHSPPASPCIIYPNHAEASRIIRRHSSSSYSSMDGDFDGDKRIEGNMQETASTESEKTYKKRSASSASDGSKIKKSKKSTEVEDTEDILKDSTETPRDKKNKLNFEKYKTFSVREVGHMVQIVLLPSFNNEAYLTPEILNELCNVMKELEDDENCHIVVISSSASSFCHGINYKTLINDKEQSRKAFAKKLAACVTNFLRILATFPKILVAGVHGDTVGLGVTILPLFDMVIASDTATFSIPNARLGCAAEGGSLLALPHLMHNVLVSELLYASRKLIAAEALRLGMVTRVLWPDKFQQELVSIVKVISNHSPQFMKVTKLQLRKHMEHEIDEILSNETDTLIQHWTSSECQKNFGVYG